MSGRKRDGGVPNPEEDPTSPASERAWTDHLADAVAEYDETGRLVWVSPRIRDVLGHEPATLTALQLAEWVHPEDLDAAESSLAAAREGDRGASFTARHRHRDGSWRWLEVSVRGFDAPGGVRHVAASHRDVHAHHTAARRKALLADAVDQAAEAVAVLDRRGRVVYANAAFEAMMGRPARELEGETMSAISNGAEDDALLQDIRTHLARGEPWHGRYGTSWSDGSRHFRDASVAPVRDASGRVRGYVGVLRDVTREYQVETRLQQSRKLEALGRLAGGVAHDFNDLLTVILGNVDLMDGAGSDAEGLEAVRDAAERGARLAGQLLAFGRQHHPAPGRFDLNAVVADCLPMLRSLIGEDVILRDALSEEALGVHGDRSQVEQIVVNLVLNARDALPEGGVIDVTTGVRRLEARTDGGLPPGDYVELRVRDDGVGMDAETLTHAFDPFFTTKADGHGSGLGLATVYGVVQGAGGAVDLESAAGRGTAVEVLLPRRALPGVATGASRDPAQGGRPHTTVLVVEDEHGVRKLMERILVREGYRVLACPDGPAALEVARAHAAAIDLVLTDVVMPGMDGIQLSEALHGVCPQARLVFMSGYVPGSMPSLRSLPPGARLLNKPFTPRDLLRTVRELKRRLPHEGVQSG